jgi:hypothetical protein
VIIQEEISFNSTGYHLLGNMPDVRNLYNPETPGIEQISGCPVIYPPTASLHLTEDHPKRIEWLECHVRLICKTIQSPSIISSKPVLHAKHNRYRLTLISRIPGEMERNNHLVVVVSLPKPHEETAHVCTIFGARATYIYTRNNFGELELKPEYIEVEEEAP